MQLPKDTGRGTFVTAAIAFTAAEDGNTLINVGTRQGILGVDLDVTINGEGVCVFELFGESGVKYYVPATSMIAVVNDDILWGSTKTFLSKTGVANGACDYGPSSLLSYFQS